MIDFADVPMIFWIAMSIAILIVSGCFGYSMLRSAEFEFDWNTKTFTLYNKLEQSKDVLANVKKEVENISKIMVPSPTPEPVASDNPEVQPTQPPGIT